MPLREWIADTTEADSEEEPVELPSDELTEEPSSPTNNELIVTENDESTPEEVEEEEEEEEKDPLLLESGKMLADFLAINERGVTSAR